jgi:hypothetical protein
MTEAPECAASKGGSGERHNRGTTPTEVTAASNCRELRGAVPWPRCRRGHLRIAITIETTEAVAGRITLGLQAPYRPL